MKLLQELMEAIKGPGDYRPEDRENPDSPDYDPRSKKSKRGGDHDEDDEKESKRDERKERKDVEPTYKASSNPKYNLEVIYDSEDPRLASKFSDAYGSIYVKVVDSYKKDGKTILCVKADKGAILPAKAKAVLGELPATDAKPAKLSDSVEDMSADIVAEAKAEKGKLRNLDSAAQGVWRARDLETKKKLIKTTMIDQFAAKEKIDSYNAKVDAMTKATDIDKLAANLMHIAHDNKVVR